MARTPIKPSVNGTNQQTETTQAESVSNEQSSDKPLESNKTNTEQRKVSKFASPEYNAPISNICICQVINHMEQEKVGLFIKDKFLGGIDWKGKEPNHKHIFASGTPEMGVLLPSPRMHILDISPRYIEQREDGAIIGIYDYDDGYDKYQALGKEKVVLRRFYLMVLVDDKNNNLHTKPIILSIKGVASVKFGEAYSCFQRELEQAFAKFEKVPMVEKSQDFHRLGVFQPSFVPSHEPKEAPNPRDKSWVAVVESYKPPKPDGSDFLDYFCEHKEEEFDTFIQSNPDFSHRIHKTSAVVAEHNRLLEAATPTYAALPPAKDMDELPY